MRLIRASALTLAAVLLLSLFCCSAGESSPYWEKAYTSAHCGEGRKGCQILQMVMYGSFSDFDASDSLQTRVLSAALLQLSEVTADDIRHFSRDFKISESVVTRLYYIALGNCLWADTLLNKNAQDATEVLRVFLDPDSVLNGREQADIIRRIITDEEIALLASMLGFHEDFVRYLIMDEDWKNPMPDDFSGVYAGSPDKGAPAPGRTPAASSALVTSAPAATPSPHPTLSPSAALLPSPSPSPSSTVHAQETEGFDDYEDSDEPEEYPSYDDSPDDDFESMDWTQDYDSSDD